MRGAGQNFGIVTSTTLQTYPYDESEGMYYNVDMIFEDQDFENVVEILNKLSRDEDPALSMTFIFAANTTSLQVSQSFSTLWSVSVLVY